MSLSWTEFVAGTSGGVASVVVGHPFDTIKTRLQAQRPGADHTPLLAHGSHAPYRGALHALATITREEKVVGLFRGVLSPVLGVGVMNASIFGLYDTALGYLQGTLGTSRREASLYETTLAGVFCGLGTACVAARRRI